jgi:hypothetical protein
MISLTVFDELLSVPVVPEIKSPKTAWTVSKIASEVLSNVLNNCKNKLAFAPKLGFSPEFVLPGVVFDPEFVFPGVAFGTEFVFPGVVFAPEFVFPVVVFAPEFVFPVVVFAPEFIFPAVVFAPESLFGKLAKNSSNKLAFLGFAFVDCRFTPTKQLIIANRATIERMFLLFKNQNNSYN